MRIKQLAALVLLSLAASSLWAQDKVVYHINDAKTYALAALRNVRNHLETDPSAKITVVADGFGVDF